jgi:hypothetical protein
VAGRPPASRDANAVEARRPAFARALDAAEPEPADPRDTSRQQPSFQVRIGTVIVEVHQSAPAAMPGPTTPVSEHPPERHTPFPLSRYYLRGD